MGGFRIEKHRKKESVTVLDLHFLLSGSATPCEIRGQGFVCELFIIDL